MPQRERERAQPRGQDHQAHRNADTVLDQIYQIPLTTSVRRTSRETEVLRSTVHRIFQAEKLYPYHLTYVQKLEEGP